MGASKVETYSDLELDIAALAKALAHPARIAILKVLARRDTCVCGDIVDELPLAQSTVSQHLKELKKARLIKGQISGPRTCYCINDEVWEFATKQLNTFFNQNKPGQSCC
jgi:predicted transcriptional regulator